MAGGLLHQRAVLLAKVEGTYNTDSGPTADTNAILVEDPDFTVDPNVLERNFSRASLSPLPHKVGRKLAGMSFVVEASSNGKSHLGTDSPAIGHLLRACGLSQTAISDASGGITPVRALPGTVSVVTWVEAGSEDLDEPVVYDIEVTTGGASGTAEVSITPDANAVGNLGQAAQTNVMVTSGQAIDLKSGGTGYTVTPTFVGSLSVGDKWQVICYPTGYLYQPVSTSFESATLYMYFDGLLHKMTGGRGTVSFEATAGEYGKFTFNFTGQYIAPVDAAMPTSPLYDQLDPPIFEQARLYMDGFPASVNSLSWDLGVQVSPRPSANSPDGYEGVRITGRQTAGGLDPEATLVGDEDFWGKMASSKQMLLRAKLGQVDGQKMYFIMPGVQYTGLSYQDRENLRTLDAGISPKGLAGDDELMLFIA